ncbi:SIMPL domain-containing protein [Microbacterium sp. 3J1]|uniref:SIMPL domain-containing protein n=1 Tax=Microbacterium sp. 3J1 TaxID=861269 RepID=UPI000A53BD48|nr:SIMPL domain-containing protein [Microbacterium sp. 3J1]
MSEVTVTVRGEHEARITPERATVRVSVRADGPERAAVVELTMRLAEPVRESIADRRAGGSVVDWSSKRLSVRAERPWNNEGKRLAPVYYAGIDLSATFTDVSDLSMWVSDISSWDGVEVGWVDWHLTPETTARVERDVAAQAVSVAVARAQAYAAALGLHEVTPVEIADVGLIAPAPNQAFAGMTKSRGAMLAASPTSDAAMEYEPEEIVISATVEARFVAR